MHILIFALVVHEHMDIESPIIGDLQRKNRCMQIRLGEVVDVMLASREIQFNFIYCGLGLEEPMDDIVPDMTNTLSLMGEFP